LGKGNGNLKTTLKTLAANQHRSNRHRTSGAGAQVFFHGELMIMIAESKTDGVDLATLHAGVFNCFDAIDEEDTGDADLIADKPRKAPETVFDGTGYGSDTFEEPVTSKKKKKKTAAKKKKPIIASPLDNKISDQQRVKFYTRAYEPSDFDKTPRPQWTPPTAANDDHKGKHSNPALDEARNNTLIAGRDRANTLIQNEWAFDILIEVKDLMDAAAPKCSWLQHDGHGETDEHTIEDNTNPGYGADVKHDYGPSVKKVKKLWEHGNDNEPSKEQRDAESLGYVPQWNLGTGSPESGQESIDGHLTDTVMSSPETGKPRWTRVLRQVGVLEFNERNQMTHFHDKKGNRLKFKTKTRGAKGPSLHPRVVPDPIDINDYGGAALPRKKNGELTAGFVAGKTGSSNSVAPDTLDFEPTAGPTHSANDPWAAQIATDNARNEATIKLSQYRLLVGDKPYDALTQAASGFRIGELCNGRLGNTTHSARNRSFLQFAIERIIEERSRSSFRPQKAA
jgi:hypothetical protein